MIIIIYDNFEIVFILIKCMCVMSDLEGYFGLF